MSKFDDQVILKQGYYCLKQCRDGYMLYNINDRYVGNSLHEYGEFSLLEKELLSQIISPGSVLLDIGANMGAHTLWMAKAVGNEGKVYAFEPQRVLFQLLCANMALNNLLNVHCMMQAVGDKIGKITVPKIDYQLYNNFGGISLSPDADGEEVDLITVDSLGLSQCDLVKIDVEGMEQLVLQGGREMIQQLSPTIYLENDRKDHSHDLIELILSFDYHCYWHCPALYHSQNYYENSHNIYDRQSSVNMLCFPKKKQVTINGLRKVTDANDWFKISDLISR